MSQPVHCGEHISRIIFVNDKERRSLPISPFTSIPQLTVTADFLSFLKDWAWLPLKSGGGTFSHGLRKTTPALNAGVGSHPLPQLFRTCPCAKLLVLVAVLSVFFANGYVGFPRVASLHVPPTSEA